MKSDKAAAAHEAFAAYEKAMIAAKEVLADGPPKGLGAAIMTEIERWGGSSGVYACSECGKQEHASGWKFCPHCGAEIMRFDKCKELSAEIVHVVTEK